MRHDNYIVKASAVQNLPFFYPVYRWGDLHSFSPLPLLIRKGVLNVDPVALRKSDSAVGDVCPPDFMLDQEIERLGGPPEFSRKISDRNRFLDEMAKALQADVNLIEAANPGKTNVILCGGKDSLNLLLLKWKNPTIAYSAAPNFLLVQDFVKQNDLGIEVRELIDIHDPDSLDREVAEACMMIELEHWRWTAHIALIAAELQHNAVFWKGQMADAFMTDYWRSYSNSQSRAVKVTRKIYRRLARKMPAWMVAPVDKILIESFRQINWSRGAVGQGAHLGFLRSITDCLFVSAYHGPNASKVWLSADFPALTTYDLRPELGRILAGRPVVYPESNPAPASSEFRKGLRNLDRLEAALCAFDVRVIKP